MDNPTNSTHKLAQLPPYSRPISFAKLAEKDPPFKALWDSTSHNIDFHAPSSNTILSQAILRQDFGLALDLPSNRLCPPVPNRWNYVSWIQRLLDSSSSSYTQGYDPQRVVSGLDIGTGASAIYALLALKSRSGWRMCVTDIDIESFEYARRNLEVNGLVSRCRMVFRDSGEGALIPFEELGVEQLDFVMCNPPFFTSVKEMQDSMAGEGKTGKPHSICTGSENEMVFPGGDLAFVEKMVEESLVLREKVTWYSSMLGKLGSARAVVERLKKEGVTNWAVGCLDPGDRTRRWVVAWSFGDLRPANSIARHTSLDATHLPFPTAYTIPLSQTSRGDDISARINDQLSQLHLYWHWDATVLSGIGEAQQNVWSRAYRRERERVMRSNGSGDDADVKMKDDQRDVQLAFRITLKGFKGDEKESGKKEVVIDWLRGSDHKIWESFCGMLQRSLRDIGS